MQIQLFIQIYTFFINFFHINTHFNFSFTFSHFVRAGMTTIVVVQSKITRGCLCIKF